MTQLTRRFDWKDRIKRWLPVAVWASFIFLFSSGNFSSSNTSQVLDPLLHWILPGISAHQMDLIHFFIRKFAHWAQYFILAALTLRALQSKAIAAWESRHLIGTIVIVLIVASADELHQSFVPSRTAALGDVMIDLFGGTCGALWMYLWQGKKAARQRNAVFESRSVGL
jgi:VanZ family protein